MMRITSCFGRKVHDADHRMTAMSAEEVVPLVD